MLPPPLCTSIKFLRRCAPDTRDTGPGRGLAQEAVERILGYARDIGLKYVYARVHDRNERSIRLLDRLGFSEAKAMPQLEIRPGVFRDCRRYNKQL